MPNENGEATDPTIVDTQTSNQTPPVQTNDEDGHGGEQGSSTQTNTDNQITGDQNPPSENQQLSPEEIAKKREEGKLQQVQKEYEEYKTQAEQDRKRLRVIVEKAMETPENYKTALKMINGYTDEQADQEISELKTNGLWTQGMNNQPYSPGNQSTPNQQQGQQTQFDPSMVQHAVQMELKQNEVRREFFKAVPAMDPTGKTTEDKARLEPFALALQARANQMMSQDPSRTDVVKNLVDAYKEFTGQTDEQINKTRADSYRQGYIEANSTNAGASGPSKGTTPPTSGVRLSSEQMQQAQAEGLSPEEYAKLSAGEITVD